MTGKIRSTGKNTYEYSSFYERINILCREKKGWKYITTSLILIRFLPEFGGNKWIKA
jgi:hypothetical protein